MSQPLTEEQRQKLLQLRQQSGFNTGVDTTFDPQEPMGQEIDTTIPELEGPSMTPINQPNMSVGQPEMPQIEAPAPVEPVQAPEPVLPQSDSVALPQPETPADVAPVDPISEQAPQKPAGTSFGQLQQDLGQAFGKQERAIQKLGDIEAREAEAAQPILEQKSKILSDYQERTKKIVDDAATDTQDQMNKIQGQIDELNKMEYKGYWQNKSTGEKILGALAVALGAYAQGLSGGKLPNTALSIINKAMDDDFKQFKAKSDKKIQLINQSKASLQMKQSAVREELARQETYKIGQLGQIEGKLGEISNKFKSESAKARAEGLMAQIQQAKIAGQSNLQAQLEASNARKAQEKLQREQFNLMKRNQKLDKKADEAKLKSSMALSKEYRSSPTTKATNVMRSSIKKMEKAPKDTAGDITLLYNFMRMNDPTSTVRESEFSMGEGVGGLPGYAQAYFEKVTGGGRLTDEQRQEILNAAQQSWAAQQEAQSEIYKEYEGVAQRYEMDPRQVLGEMEKQPIREVTRMTKDGRRAVFNAATKEFLRYE